MFDLKSRTIHFDLSYLMPINNLSYEGLSKFESNLQKKDLQIIGKVSPNLSTIQLNCKTSEGTIFFVKFDKVGEIKTAEKEPLYALSVISSEEGNENSLYLVYSIIIDSIPNEISISGLSLRRQSTLRKLYGPIKNMHAFKFLWENVLSQQEDSLKPFHGIGGGGLQIVPSPKPTSFLSPAEGIEILQAKYKVESFLRDPRYLFIEAKYVWPEPFHFRDINTLKKSIQPRCDWVLKDITDTIETFVRSLTK